MEVDKEKAIIYGDHGSVTYYVNDCGGVEITAEADGGITDSEYAADVMKS